MGLDQALIKFDKESFALVQKWLDGGREGDFPEVESERLWTGRKENHIQAFFENEVGDVDNCGYLVVGRFELARLVHRLARVDVDHSLAGALLPAQEGFFFGGTEYDEYYFSAIADELDALSEILDNWDDDAVYAYWAWW